MYPLAGDLAATGAPIRVPVAVTCRVLKFSTQAFYKWLKAPVSQREWDDAHIINAAMAVHRKDPAFGYRFIADELHQQGFTATTTKIGTLCSQQKIFSEIATRVSNKPKRSKPPAHDDLVRRRFNATRPNMVWLTDITEHPTNEGKLYACLIKDLFSNRIVGYSIGPRMTKDLAVSCLNNAAAQRNTPNTIIHSDRGSQFQSQDFKKLIVELGARGSMGQVHTCADNAAMESFNALLQNNVLDSQKVWKTRAELRGAIVEWIEGTYHRRRRQSALGKLTPIEFETIFKASPEVEMLST